MAAKKTTAQDEVLVLTELEQLRALADPLRSRILTLLCRQEHTTKQVADALGEKPTKLYHHVETLERAGLIRLTRTQQNRGTLEKYFLGVARRFEAGPTLLGAAPDSEAASEETDALTAMVNTIFEQARGELHRFAGAEAGLLEELEASGMITFAEVHADQKLVDRMRRRLDRLVKDLAKEDDGDASTTPERKYRMLIAYYPLDRFPDEG